jgi:8-oxo-dGTP pyrophosphatase MutT (NUDIX family)
VRGIVIDFVDALRRRLREPLPGPSVQWQMAPRPRTPLDPNVARDSLKQAAALLLFYEHEHQWHIPLTLRGSGLRHHTGQVSLPGGRIEPGETPERAALREAYEEVGLMPDAVDVLGTLTPLPIAVSGHLLHPVVAYAAHRPQFVIAEDEVARLLEVPVSELQPPLVKWERRLRSNPPLELMDVPFFQVEDVQVWGATAMVLAEFVALVNSSTTIDAVSERRV